MRPTWRLTRRSPRSSAVMLPPRHRAKKSGPTNQSPSEPAFDRLPDLLTVHISSEPERMLFDVKKVRGDARAAGEDRVPQPRRDAAQPGDRQTGRARGSRRWRATKWPRILDGIKKDFVPAPTKCCTQRSSSTRRAPPSCGSKRRSSRRLSVRLHVSRSLGHHERRHGSEAVMSKTPFVFSRRNACGAGSLARLVLAPR